MCMPDTSRKRKCRKFLCNFACSAMCSQKYHIRIKTILSKREKLVNSCRKNIIIKIVMIGARKTEKIDSTYIFRVKNDTCGKLEISFSCTFACYAYNMSSRRHRRIPEGN